MEEIKENYQQLKVKYDKLVGNLKNYRHKLQKEIENVSDILEKQPFTIFHSEEYYQAQKLEKMRTGMTIDSLIEEIWSIDRDGNIVECPKKRRSEI